MRKKRSYYIEKRLISILQFYELKTQELRVKLIAQLEQLFEMAINEARTAENRDDWMKVASYIAQVINSLARSYDEVKFNEDMQKLRELIRIAKEKAGTGKIGEGVGVA